MWRANSFHCWYERILFTSVMQNLLKGSIFQIYHSGVVLTGSCGGWRVDFQVRCSKMHLRGPKRRRARPVVCFSSVVKLTNFRISFWPSTQSQRKHGAYKARASLLLVLKKWDYWPTLLFFSPHFSYFWTSGTPWIEIASKTSKQRVLVQMDFMLMSLDQQLEKYGPWLSPQKEQQRLHVWSLLEMQNAPQARTGLAFLCSSAGEGVENAPCRLNTKCGHPDPKMPLLCQGYVVTWCFQHEPQIIRNHFGLPSTPWCFFESTNISLRTAITGEQWRAEILLRLEGHLQESFAHSNLEPRLISLPFSWGTWDAWDGRWNVAAAVLFSQQTLDLNLLKGSVSFFS